MSKDFRGTEQLGFVQTPKVLEFETLNVLVCKFLESESRKVAEKC